MTLRRCLVLAASLSSLPACSSLSAEKHAELQRLATWMTGTFSSAAQHNAQPADFLDIRLVTVPIWTERADGPWLYVEQAVAAEADKPYRQRVYHLVRHPDGTFQSDVFTLPGDALTHAGAWRTDPALPGIAPEMLVERSGCSITLRCVDAQTFLGSTHAHDCPSERQGAQYATSEVAITTYGLTSWDRGFDAAGTQMWGSRTGPYCFDKLSDGPPE